MDTPCSFFASKAPLWSSPKQVVDLDGVNSNGTEAVDEEELNPGVTPVDGWTKLRIQDPWTNNPPAEALGSFTLSWTNPSGKELWLNGQASPVTVPCTPTGWPTNFTVTRSTNWVDWLDSVVVTLSHSISTETDQVRLGQVASVNLTGHRTCGYLGMAVEEEDEDIPGNFIIFVNDDYEERPHGGAADCEDSLMRTNYEQGEEPDDDVVRFTLHKPGLMPSDGTLRIAVSAPGSVRLFKGDGSGLPLSNTTVNLSAPAGDLAGLLMGGVDVWMEGLQSCADLTVSYTYQNAHGQEAARDEIHLSLVRFRLYDQQGNPLDEALKVPKDLMLAWGVENDSSVPVLPLAQFTMEVEGLDAELVESAVVESEDVPSDWYAEELDPDSAVARSLWFGTVYSSAADDLITGAEKAAIKANRAANTVHNANARVRYETEKDMLRRRVRTALVNVLPLGGSVASVSTSEWFCVYVPTCDGGKLTVSVNGGTLGDIKKWPEGTVYINGTDMPPFDGTNQSPRAWYFFRVDGGGYSVSNSFIQEGEAVVAPWNFWFWPFRTDADGSKLFDNPGPYTRFDDYFHNYAPTSQPSCAAFDWEVATHMRSGSGADGHCWGGAMASCIIAQPSVSNVPSGNPTGFTEEDLEGFATELFNSARALNPPDGIMISPKRLLEPGTNHDWAADIWVDTLHRELVWNIRREKRPFLMDLCTQDQAPAIGGPSGWNHAVYKYRADMVEDPNAVGGLSNRVRQILITTTFTANSDFQGSISGLSTGNPRDNPETRREQTTEYRLVFDERGIISEDGYIKITSGMELYRQDWRAMQMTYVPDPNATLPYTVYSPTSLVRIDEAARTQWQRGMPEANIRSNSNVHVTYERLYHLGLRNN